MKMAKSSTKKDKLPEEISRHLNLFTDYIKYWTDRELKRLSEVETIPLCIPTKDGYRIGNYKLRVLDNKTCEVYSLNRDLIHIFDSKLSAILHTVYTIKKNYKLADELLLWDKEINKNYTDVLSLRRSINLARKQEHYDIVDIRTAKLEIAESRLRVARDKISKMYNHAKYIKVWG